MVELNEKPSLVEITSSYLHEHLPGMTVGTIVITDHQEEERTSLYAIKTSAVTAFIGKGGGAYFQQEHKSMESIILT